MHQKILAVDDEPDILRLTQFLLESWGYDVVTAANGKKAIETAQAETPDLILMDVNMEEMNGFEACAKLKSDFATSFIPVIMLTSQDQVQNKITGLGQGADDYVIKTVDPLELQARIEMVIRRTQETSAANPLTRLPGNIALEREIKNRLQGGAHFSVCYCDLDNFKAYNDKYGYEAGDKVIVHTAQLLMDVVRELSDGGDFVEHIGGDDFVILTSPERDSDICRRVVDGFDQTIPDFYGEEDRARKGIQVENRSGHLENFPLMTITVAVVSGSREDLKSTHVIAERAAELKKYLKRFAGSNYLSERRGVREPSKDRQTEKVATMIAAFSFLLRRFMRAEGAMAFGVAANIFLGIIEAPLLIRPYLAGMSRSSLFTVITAGMATVAGTVMALYAGVLRSVVDNAAGQILVASIISVPAAVLIAQILIPSEGTTVPEETHELRIKTKSAFEALINGTLDGMRMVLNIAAVIIVLFAVISLVNQVLSQLSETLTLQWLVGWVFTPFCWLMGIPAGEAVAAGRLMATKTMLNEFVAYMQMAGAGGAGLSERTRLILTYAMCGFANFGSVGILVGGLGTILPDRKAEIVNLALRAIIAGTLATMMTGAVIAIVA